MKRIFPIVLSLLLMTNAALALTQSQIPPKFGIPWGNNAAAAFIRSIPATSQIGIQNCAASLPDGFPPLSFTPVGAGGCPPFGQDFNGILKQLSQWNQWQSAGGPVFFDAAFATTAGGYPNGARLQSSVTPGTTWFNTGDSNATNPDAPTGSQVVGGSGWVQDPGQIPVGTPIQSLTTTIQAGYVSANGLTIGNAASNATDRANADTQFLFAFIWSNCGNPALCPLFTSSGSAATRGVSAAADFAANKAIAVPNMNGTGLMGADSQNGASSTFLSGVPIVVGNTSSPMSIIGANLHTLTLAEIPAGIASTGGNSFSASANNNIVVTNTQNVALIAGATNLGSGGFAVFTNAQAGTLTSSGNNLITVFGSVSFNSTSFNTGGGAHSVVDRSTLVYWELKL
jgi:hypothetical protein